ncbi:MAG: flagellar hook-length control protein FliK, partial [Butyrivibrio sp.]|nr:flagellar hook-length control protein FliK [Butyrivibrio sp.]
MTGYAISQIAGTMKIAGVSNNPQAANGSAVKTNTGNAQGGGDFRQVMFEASVSKITVNASVQVSDRQNIQGAQDTQKLNNSNRPERQSSRSTEETGQDRRNGLKADSKTGTKADTKATMKSDAAAAETDETDEPTTESRPTGLEELFLMGQGDNLTEEEIGLIEDGISDFVTELADILGEDEEDILQAVEILGLADVQILDPQQLTEVVTEVKDVEDITELITDGKLSGMLTEARETLTDAREELAEALDMPAEDLDQTLAQFRLQEEPETLDLRGESDKGAESFHIITGDADIADKIQIDVSGMEKPYAPSQDGEQGDGQDAYGEDFGRSFMNTGLQEEDPVGAMTKSVETIFSQLLDRMSDSLQSMQDVNAAAQAAMEARANAQNIIDQITEFIKVNVKPDVPSMELQLHPQNLGHINIQIATAGDGNLVAKFVTQNETVRAAIESE